MSTSEERLRSLSKVREWRISPTPGEMSRSLYLTPSLQKVLSKGYGIIIGRKGTGKTAVAQYLIESSPRKSLLLNFSDFRFSDLKEYKEEGLVSNFAYVTAWKYIILNSFISLMVEAECFPYPLQGEMQKLFHFDPTGGLSKASSRWGRMNFNLSVFGVDAGISAERTDYRSLGIFEKVRCLEEMIRKADRNPGAFRIVFDELDMGFSFLDADFEDSEYSSILCSLLKAAAEINSDLRTKQFQLNCLVFIRDDIFDVLRDPDKNKWLDNAISLEWNPYELMKMCTHLLSADEPHPVGFDSLFEVSVRKSKMMPGTSTRANVTLVEYFFECTHWRPRDVIMFFRALSDVALTDRCDLIRSGHFNEGQKIYSRRLKQEIVDEVHTVLPNIEEILDVLSYSGRVRFRKEDLYSLFRTVSPNARDEKITSWISILYYFSIFGVVGSRGLVFKYLNPGSKYVGQQNLEIHPGLRPSVHFAQ